MTVQENLVLSLEYAARTRARGGDRARQALGHPRAWSASTPRRRIRSARLTQIEMRKLELARAHGRPAAPC